MNAVLSIPPPFRFKLHEKKQRKRKRETTASCCMSEKKKVKPETEETNKAKHEILNCPSQKLKGKIHKKGGENSAS